MKDTRMHRRTFLKSTGAALGYSLLPITAPAQTFESLDAKGRAIIAELEKVIPKLMDQSVVPGISVALIKNGRLLWRRAFGLKDSLTKEPVDHETVFEAASISKTVFAYAGLKLCESGSSVLIRHLPSI